MGRKLYTFATAVVAILIMATSSLGVCEFLPHNHYAIDAMEMLDAREDSANDSKEEFGDEAFNKARRIKSIGQTVTQSAVNQKVANLHNPFVDPNTFIIQSVRPLRNLLCIYRI